MAAPARNNNAERTLPKTSQSKEARFWKTSTAFAFGIGLPLGIIGLANPAAGDPGCNGCSHGTNEGGGSGYSNASDNSSRDADGNSDGGYTDHSNGSNQTTPSFSNGNSANDRSQATKAPAAAPGSNAAVTTDFNVYASGGLEETLSTYEEASHDILRYDDDTFWKATDVDLIAGDTPTDTTAIDLTRHTDEDASQPPASTDAAKPTPQIATDGTDELESELAVSEPVTSEPSMTLLDPEFTTSYWADLPTFEDDGFDIIAATTIEPEDYVRLPSGIGDNITTAVENAKSSAPLFETDAPDDPARSTVEQATPGWTPLDLIAPPAHASVSERRVTREPLVTTAEHKVLVDTLTPLAKTGTTVAGAGLAVTATSPEPFSKLGLGPTAVVGGAVISLAANAAMRTIELDWVSYDSQHDGLFGGWHLGTNYPKDQ